MRIETTLRTVLVLGVLSAGIAAAPLPAAFVAPALASGALEAFGGKAGIDAMTQTFVDIIVADPRIGPFFKDKNLRRLHRMLADQFCMELDGGCEYKGRSMFEAHAHLDVREEHFLALVEGLQNAMDRHEIPFSAQNVLLARLAPMYKDIVRTEVERRTP